MNNFNSFSGNGYEERQAMINKNLINRQTYAKEQDKLRKIEEEQKLNLNREELAKDKIDAMKSVGPKPLPQNHMRFPGNNMFKR